MERYVSHPESTESPELAARYGRTAASARRGRWVIVASAAAFIVVFGAWLWWGGLLGAPAQLEAEDTGHVITSDSEVIVRWRLSVEPNSGTRCAVQALNSTFAIVGWKIVDVPASPTRTRELAETVRTTEQAVTGLIYRCWLT
jgi:hypothetical protein